MPIDFCRCVIFRRRDCHSGPWCNALTALFSKSVRSVLHRFFAIAAIGIALCPTLSAQSEEKFEIRKLGECGLVTRYASSQIGDTCLQQADNVYLDEDAGISRRKGYSKYNTTAITDSKSVRGTWPFRATDGTEYMVVLSSQTMFQSNGSGSFTAIPGLNGRSATQDMDCAQCLGKLWCVNGSDTMFSWDGASSSTVSGAPTCAAVDCFRNRVVEANCSGTLSQLRMSGELDGTDYTIPATPVSTSPVALSVGGVNDGKKVQCIQGVYQDVMVLGKEDSTWGLYGFDRRDFAVREISREVGCIENRSGREKQGSLYWLSKRGVEKMTGPSIVRVSDPIRDLVDTIIVAGGNTRSNTDTTQSDFEAGNLTASGAGAPMSAVLNINSITPSTWGITVGVDSAWAQTDVDSTTVVGDVDNFDDGELLNDVTWTKSTGYAAPGDGTPVVYDFSVSTTDRWATGTQTVGNVSSMSTPISDSSGTWSIVIVSTGGSVARLNFVSDSVCPFADPGNWYRATLWPANAGNSVSLQKYVSGTLTQVASAGVSGLNDGNEHTYRISRSSSGWATVAVDGVVVISVAGLVGISSNSYTVIVSQDNATPYNDIHFSKIKFPNSYKKQASTIYDSGVSTPTFGPYLISFSSVSTSSATFSIQSSTADDGGGFEALATQTPNAGISASKRRYLRHHVYQSPPESATVSSISSIGLSAATTGYFISQCRNPGTAITQWGLFQCNGIANSGSLTYYISTGTSCNQVTRTTATWTAQTNNTIIAVATAPFVAYRTLFGIDSATQTPTLNDCTINWNEGTSRPAVSAEVYRDRYYLAYTSGTSGTVANDEILVLDSRDQWVIHDQPNCSSLGIYNRSLYCGDSGSNGQVYQMDVGQDDDGSSFTSSIRTKDFDFGNTWQKKQLSRMYFDLSGLPDPGYSISLTPSYTLDASTDIFTLSDINLNEDYSRFIAAKVPALLSNNVTGRWFNFSLSNTGVYGPWSVYGIKVIFSRLTED